MKTMRFLMLLVGSIILTYCTSNKQMDENSSTEVQENFNIGGKEYTMEEMEKILNFFENSQNPNDINRYKGDTIKRTTGAPIDQGLAQTFIEEFKVHSRQNGQPHAFAYGLDFLTNVIKQLDAVSANRVDSLKYTGLRIYVTKDLRSREWNTVLVGTTMFGRDIFSPTDSVSLLGDPVYNSSLPCPQNCP